MSPFNYKMWFIIKNDRISVFWIWQLQARLFLKIRNQTNKKSRWKKGSTTKGIGRSSSFKTRFGILLIWKNGRGAKFMAFYKSINELHWSDPAMFPLHWSDPAMFPLNVLNFCSGTLILGLCTFGAWRWRHVPLRRSESAQAHDA